MIKISKFTFFILSSVALLLFSCSAGENDPGVEYAPQMYHSVPYEGLSQIENTSAGSWLSNREDGLGEFYNSNVNNPFNMNMRQPAPHTVKRSESGFLPYRIHKDSLEVAAKYLKNPIEVSEEVLLEGKELYGRFCQHCHGESGDGKGKLATEGKINGVPSYKSQAIKNKPEGHIFHVITHGKGLMGAHGSQIDQEERWKIVHYVQTLQKN